MDLQRDSKLVTIHRTLMWTSHGAQFGVSEDKGLWTACDDGRETALRPQWGPLHGTLDRTPGHLALACFKVTCVFLTLYLFIKRLGSRGARRLEVRPSGDGGRAREQGLVGGSRLTPRETAETAPPGLRPHWPLSTLSF